MRSALGAVVNTGRMSFIAYTGWVTEFRIVRLWLPTRAPAPRVTMFR